MMMNREPVRAGGGFDGQAEGRLPLPESVQHALENLIERQSHTVALEHIRATEQALANAQVAEIAAQEKLQGHLNQITEARSAFKSAPTGSWAVGSGLLVSFAAFVTAEWLMNAEVLPWLFSVSSGSIEAITLSLAPAAAPIMLDQVLDKVFHVSAARIPIQQMSGRAIRTAAMWAWRALPLLAAGCLMLAALWMLAETRPVLSAIKENVEALGPTSAQQHIIDRAMQWMAIAVAIAGAFCYLLGIDNLRCAYNRRKAALLLARLERGTPTLETVLMQARVQSRISEREWADVNSRAEQAAAFWTAERGVVLARLAANPGSLREQVEMALWGSRASSPPPLAETYLQRPM